MSAEPLPWQPALCVRCCEPIPDVGIARYCERCTQEVWYRRQSLAAFLADRIALPRRTITVLVGAMPSPALMAGDGTGAARWAAWVEGLSDDQLLALRYVGPRMVLEIRGALARGARCPQCDGTGRVDADPQDAPWI